MKSRTICFDNLPHITNRARWSKLLGVPVTTLMNEENRGRLRATRIGYNVFYSKEEVLQWLKSHGRSYATIE